jgi:hypothetical protein
MTASDDAEPSAKKLKPNDPPYVHIRLPLRLSTALSDPVFVECPNVDFIRNNNPSNKYLLHIASLILGIECIFIRIRRREDGGDAADDDVSWADISETGDIRGGTYLCDFEDCTNPGMYLTLATLVEPFQIKVDPVAIRAHTSSSLRNTLQNTPEQQTSTPNGVPADQVEGASSSTSTERLPEPPPSILQERPNVYMVFLYLSSINL